MLILIGVLILLTNSDSQSRNAKITRFWTRVIENDEGIKIDLTKDEAKELYNNDLILFRKAAMSETLHETDFCRNFDLLIKMSILLAHCESINSGVY
jgi:hypothetical protein